MRICILNTGGTISCVGTPLAPMPAARFAQAAGDLLGGALAAALPTDQLHFDTNLRFSDQGPGTLDSTDLRPSDWCRMARRVLELYTDHDAFVILHGTDTMDYSGAALAFLLNVFDDLGMARAALSKPVILTGAQLPLFVETPDGLVLNAGGDGLSNLTGALQAARLRLPEVTIFFDGKLLRGARALKVSTTRFAGFDSPHLAPLAERGIGIHMGRVAPLAGPATPDIALESGHALALAQLNAVEACIDDQRVAQIPAIPADHHADRPLLADLVRATVEYGATGLVLEGFGPGNFPAGNGAIETAITDAGVPVLVVSRVIDGQVGAFDYAAGMWIGATGAVSAGDMTPVAGLAKMIILNAAATYHGWDRDAVNALLARSLVGECAATDRLNGTLWPGQSITATDGPVRIDNDPDTGPRMTHDGTLLWQAPGPGRLQMRGDRLVVIASDGAVIWHSLPAPGAVAVLNANPPTLRLIDPSRRASPVTALAG